jgi:SnoaL-like domain
MKPRSTSLTLALVLAALSTPSLAKKDRPSISDGERAAATWAVQNLMSRHEYMHAAGLNLEEIDGFWVSRSGAHAKTATFASPGWVMNGIETVRAAYGQQSRKDAEAARQALAAVDPGVKDSAEFYGAGAEWVMHTSTTPVIEIAGDGKTAQGAWYSPGMGIMPKLVDGKVQLQAMMFWEKYGADFVKENGVWKIWHLQMAYDFVPGLPKEMVEQVVDKLGQLAYRGPAASSQGEAGERMGGALPPGFSKPKYVYPAYSPQRASVIWPNLPKPYYTFSETFNNCNCDQ